MINDTTIVIGSDSGSEWQIAPWFYRYKQNNNIPVTIWDFGMTDEAIRFSKKYLIYKKMDKKLKSVWLLKPRCLFEADFKNVIWMDLDCKVLGNIEQICDYCNGFSVRNESCGRQDFWGRYQCGVVATNKNSLLLKMWMEDCEKENAHEVDQKVLSDITESRDICVQKLPLEFNRTKRLRDDLKCIVFHCNGKAKKINLSEGVPNDVDFNFDFSIIKTDLNGGRKINKENYTFL